MIYLMVDFGMNPNIHSLKQITQSVCFFYCSILSPPKLHSTNCKNRVSSWIICQLPNEPKSLASKIANTACLLEFTVQLTNEPRSNH